MKTSRLLLACAAASLFGGALAAVILSTIGAISALTKGTPMQTIHLVTIAAALCAAPRLHLVAQARNRMVHHRLG